MKTNNLNKWIEKNENIDINNFDNFIKDFETWLLGQKEYCKKFLWVDFDVKFEIKSYHTFAFDLESKNIIIPTNFLENYYSNLKSNNNQNKYLYTFDDLKFWLYHELSHYRDIINEKNQNNRNVMVNFLKSLQKEKIKISDDKYIPIWRQLHIFFNCIDDIVVNTEVEMFIWAWINKQDLLWFYKYNLFADIKEKKGGDYAIKNWNKIYVWDEIGTHYINDKNDVDYSKIQFYNSFSYFFLRKFMVPDQKVLLDKKVENVIYKNDSRTQVNTYKGSIRQMINNMNSYYLEVSKNEKYNKRCKNLQYEYIKAVDELEKILKNEYLTKIIQQCILKTNTSRNFLAWSISFFDLIKLFTLSTWRESKDHNLDIAPSYRYEIYKILFLPLQKGFILMDLLTQDIKKEWELELEWELEWKGWLKWEWIHHSPDIKEKLKFLEDLEKSDEKREVKKLIKKQNEKTIYDTNSILKSSWVSEIWLDTYNNIINKYYDMVIELFDFFLKELQDLDIKETILEYKSRKWKFNIKDFVWVISKDPEINDIWKKRFYDKKEVIEKLSEKLKKVDLTIAIDVSWSMDQFKWKNWILNIVSTVLFLTMKKLEAHIQNIIWDTDYNIDVKYILYWDWKPFTSYNSNINSSSQEVLIAFMNENIISLTWWTNDTTAWVNIANEFDKYMSSNTEYVEEILDGKRKPIILQLADIDVTENWVEILKKVFKKYIIDDNKLETIPIKRIILWNVDTVEYDESKEKLNWQKNILPDGRVVLKQIWIKSKNEIISQIKKLFENFFKDLNI